MISSEMVSARKKLGKTQKELAELLGVSIKAVHSYEQGWRKIPGHVERQIFFLLSRMRDDTKKIQPCWTVRSCPTKRKKNCPAWEFQAGRLCWFINGTSCEGVVHKTWEEKMKICRICPMITSILGTVDPTDPGE